jgi:hypothetical protein
MARAGAARRGLHHRLEVGPDETIAYRSLLAATWQ